MRVRVVAVSFPRRVYTRLIVMSLSLSVLATVLFMITEMITDSIDGDRWNIPLLVGSLVILYIAPAVLTLWILRNVKRLGHVFLATTVVWLTWSLGSTLAFPIHAWQGQVSHWTLGVVVQVMVFNTILGMTVGVPVVTCGYVVIRIGIYKLVAQTGMLCWHCGYDCTGIRGRICPECGSIASVPRRTWLGGLLLLDKWRGRRRALVGIVGLIWLLSLASSLVKSSELRNRYAEALGVPASSMLTEVFMIVPDAQFGQNLIVGVSVSEPLDEDRDLYIIRIVPLHGEAESPPMQLQLGMKNSIGVVHGVPMLHPVVYADLSDSSAQYLREQEIPMQVRQMFLDSVDLWIASGQTVGLDGGKWGFSFSSSDPSKWQKLDADALIDER